MHGVHVCAALGSSCEYLWRAPIPASNQGATVPRPAYGGGGSQKGGGAGGGGPRPSNNMTPTSGGAATAAYRAAPATAPQQAAAAQQQQQQGTWSGYAAAASMRFPGPISVAAPAAYNPSYAQHNTAYASQPPQQAAPPLQPQQQQRVPTAASPATTNSSGSSSNAGSQNGTISTSVSTGGTGAEQLSKTNLYIRGLNQNTTDKDLVNMCSQFGTIISTKAILDKNTNKCKGYGFVDFESPVAAEAAVKALQAKGIQAQMAKVGISLVHRRQSQQEQDPTNLYIANLPVTYKENDLDSMLTKYGQVISTRILRDTNGQSKGVGFARMESKEKCEQIIQMFNANPLPGCKEPLLVKFADGGNKKRSNLYKSPDQRMWGKDVGEGAPVAYDPSGVMTQNGIPTQLLPASLGQYGRTPYGTQLQGYSMPSTPWVPAQYVMQPHLQQVEDQYTCQLAATQTHSYPYKSENQHSRSISVPCLQMMPSTDPAMQFSSMIPGLTTHMSALQLGTSGSYIAAGHPHYGFYPQATSIIHTMPMESEQPSNATSPDEYQPYQSQPNKVLSPNADWI
ncbi:hypothetical protein B566_EDAN009861 [Ephemera danica]|nr:hypothetical protein B566_EDAN009861 [Ephemera danica]